MFCDLVGSTALAARLDPEDLREVIGAYHRCVASTVTRFDGFVAQYMGDGVLSYFGYPLAHEDDAERAVRAGLAIVEAVGQLQASERLRVRIGIATGLVVVGDLVGAGDAQERGAVGSTPNLAARLQAVAEANTVVIAASTRRLLGHLFEYRDLGVIDAKGFAEPVQAWEVLHARAVESRFEAFHATGTLTPLAGREEEIELLLRRWQQAKHGEGHVVLFSGEPGIGKSRISRAMQERLAGEPHTRLSYYCLTNRQASALHPFINRLERAAGFERDDTADLKLDKLEALLSQSNKNVAREVALMAELLSIPTDGRYPPLDLSPQRRKEETLTALLAQLDGLAARQPMLMIFEDAHWIDPTSLELLERTVDRVQNLPVLLIVTSRPEFAPRWAHRPHVRIHPLNRLSRREGQTMIERVAGRAVPPEVVDQIIKRTDGIPLFLEEVTKTILESGALRLEGERYVLTAPLPLLAIPETLHASLMARLDRLSPVRSIAEVGAAIGREFSHELIARVAAGTESDLNEALEQLVASELVFRRGTPPDAVYTFKHALVQDAAYSMILRGPRQRLHARIGETLEKNFPEVAATQPELLAHHCAEGGLPERAIDYLFAAGERALHASANIEAIKHLSQGINLLTSLPDTPERQRKELRFQTTLGATFLATRGWAALEAAQAFHRAEELCRALGDNGERFKIVLGLWLYYQTRGDNHRARPLSEELFRLAEEANNDDLRLEAHHAAWSRCNWTGEFAGAWEHAERGLALYSVPRHRSHALTYIGHDPGVCGWAHRALDLWLFGYPDQAAEHLQRALALAEQVAHAPTVAHALDFGLLCHQFRRDEAMVRAWGDRLAALAAEQALALPQAGATAARGWLLANQGQAASGLSELRRAMNGCKQLGMRLFEPYHCALLAAAHFDAGAASVGLELLEEAMRFADESGLRYWDAELLRLKGRLVTHREEAEACYRGALAVARRQQARSLELRAAVSLAQLWRDDDRRDEARDLLAPVYGWFTEGFNMPDLREANALLDELQQPKADPVLGARD